MANKESTIKTIFALDGETKYKDAIKGISAEQRELQSELKKADAAYKLNGDKVEYNKSKVEILNKQYDLQKKKVDETKHAMEQSIKVHGENSAETQKLKTEYNKAETQLMKYEKQLNDATAELAKQEAEAKKLGNATREMGEKMQAAGTKMKGVGDNMTKFVSGPIAAIGAAATAAFIEVDNSLDDIAMATGATGNELKGLQKVWEDVVRTMPIDMEKASDAVGELNTQFGWTGTVLEDATRLTVQFAEISGSDVVGAVQGAKKALEIFGLEATEYERILEVVAKQSQDTGVDTKRMFDAIQKGGPILRDVGIPLEEAVVLIAQMEQHGVDATRSIGYLARAQSTLAKEGKPLNQGLAEFQELVQSSASDIDKTTAAAELFGTKGAVVMLDAVQRGVFDFDELGEAAAGAGGTINRTFEETLDPIDQHKTLLNNAKIAGAELSENIQIAMAPAMESLIDVVSGAVDKFQGLDEETQQFIVNAGLVVAAIGPALSVGGRLVETVGKGVTGWGNLIDKLAMSPGVIGNVTTALGSAGTAGLVAGIALAGVAIYGVVKELTKVDPAVKDARKALEDFAETGQNAITEVSGQADMIVRYRDELLELSAVEDKTATQKARMSELVERLNTLVPELALAYDEERDALNRTKNEMIELTQASLERVAAAARAKILEEGLDREMKILGDIGKKRQEMSEMEAAHNAITESLNKARLTGLSDFDIAMAQSSLQRQKASGWEKELTQEQIEAIEELTRVTGDHARDIETFTGISTKGWTDSVAAASLLNTEMDGLTPVLGELEGAFDSMRESGKRQIEVFDEYINETYGVGEATEELASSISTESSKAAGALGDSVDDMADDLDRLADEFDMSREEMEEHYDKLEKLAESNKNQMNRFTKERFDYEKGTKEQFLKMWEDEVIAFQTYETNLQIIASKVGPDVAAELRKLGPEAAPLIQQFVDGTDEDMKRLATVVQNRTEAARKAAAGELGLLSSEGEKGGKLLADGLIRGLEGKKQALINAGRASGDAMSRGTKMSLEIASPSKVGDEIGQNFGGSIADGVEKKERDVARSGSDIAAALVEATRLTDPLIKAELAAASRVSSTMIPAAYQAMRQQGAITNSRTFAPVINVQVPEGATEDFGRRVGQSIADQLRVLAFQEGR